MDADAYAYAFMYAVLFRRFTLCRQPFQAEFLVSTISHPVFILLLHSPRLPLPLALTQRELE